MTTSKDLNPNVDIRAIDVCLDKIILDSLVGQTQARVTLIAVARTIADMESISTEPVTIAVDPNAILDWRKDGELFRPHHCDKVMVPGKINAKCMECGLEISQAQILPLMRAKNNQVD